MNLPLLPLRDIVVFPMSVITICWKDKSINALNNVMASEKKILGTQKILKLMTQKMIYLITDVKVGFYSYLNFRTAL